MAREFTRLKEIEGERAKRRFGGHHKDGATVENFPPLEPEGTARDIAAQKLGMSGFVWLWTRARKWILKGKFEAVFSPSRFFFNEIHNGNIKGFRNAVY